MRTVSSYSEQTEIWAELLDYFSFKRVIFVHSSDQEGRAMLGKFQSKTEADALNKLEISDFRMFAEDERVRLNSLCFSCFRV